MFDESVRANLQTTYRRNRSVDPFGFEPQVELSGGIVMSQSALYLLGDGVNILETPLHGGACVDGAGAEDLVSNIGDPGGFTNRMRACQPQPNTPLQTKRICLRGFLPQLFGCLFEKRLRRTKDRLGSTDITPDHLLVAANLSIQAGDVLAGKFRGSSQGRAGRLNRSVRSWCRRSLKPRRLHVFSKRCCCSRAYTPVPLMR